jgi:hypothetical protein
MLSVIMFDVTYKKPFVLSVVRLSVVLLSVIRLNVVQLSVVLLNVVMLNGMAPKTGVIIWANKITELYGLIVTDLRYISGQSEL